MNVLSLQCARGGDTHQFMPPKQLKANPVIIVQMVILNQIDLTFSVQPNNLKSPTLVDQAMPCLAVEKLQGRSDIVIYL